MSALQPGRWSIASYLRACRRFFVRPRRRPRPARRFSPLSLESLERRESPTGMSPQGALGSLLLDGALIHAATANVAVVQRPTFAVLHEDAPGGVNVALAGSAGLGYVAASAGGDGGAGVALKRDETSTPAPADTDGVFAPLVIDPFQGLFSEGGSSAGKGLGSADVGSGSGNAGAGSSASLGGGGGGDSGGGGSGHAAAANAGGAGGLSMAAATAMTANGSGSSATPTVSAPITGNSMPNSVSVSASAGPGQQQPVPANPATLPTSVTPAAAPPVGAQAGTPADTPSQAAGTPSLAAGFGSTGLGFEMNEGQDNPQVRFQAQGGGVGLWLTDDAMVFAVNRPPVAQAKPQVPNLPSLTGKPLDGVQVPSSAGRDVFRLSMVGANPDAELVGVDELQTRSNYFIGSDPAQWHTDVPQYARVEYRDVFPGVDLALHGRSPTDSTFEYDYIVKPGASPDAVRLRWDGLNGVSVDAQGRMHLVTGGGEVIQDAPVVYQDIGAVRRQVAVQPVLRPGGEFGFDVTGAYDRSQPLVIDPAISFATYLGGSSTDFGYAVAVDAAGNSYLAGTTTSTDFPVRNGFDQATGTWNAFVSKLSAHGDQLVFSSVFGGSSNSFAYAIAVDPSGSVYVAGSTGSSDFPTTQGAFDWTAALDNGFITKLNASGDSPLYSTFLGHGFTNGISAIAVNALGEAYVTGKTTDALFPTTAGAFQTSVSGDVDSFVTKLNAAGSGLIYSTFLGGSVPYAPGTLAISYGNGIAIDSAGNAYVTGETTCSDFPTNGGLFTSTQGTLDATDAFVVKLNATGTAMTYGTLLPGNSDDVGTAIAVDHDGKAYVTGYTDSSDFPTTTGAVQTSLAGGLDALMNGISDAFVTCLNPAGTAVVYSTYLGGSGRDAGWGIAVDSHGRATVVGTNGSTDFPTSNPIVGSYLSGGSFVAQLAPTGALSYSSYYGGSGDDRAVAVALDPRENAYVVGAAFSTDLPGTSLGFQTSNHGGSDAFLVKIILPPAAPRITGISSDTGDSSTDLVTTDQTLTISGTADAYVTVTLERADVGVLGSVQADGSGNWSYDYTGTTLAEGTYDFVARATNADGVKSDYSWPEFLVTVDRTAPQVSITAPSSTASLGPEIRVVARDLIGVPASATVTLDVDLNNDGDFLDAGETGYATGTLADGQVTIKLPTLPAAGTYRVRARVTDLAGNEGTSPVSTIVVNSVISAWTATATTLSADPVTGDWQNQLGDVSLQHDLDLDRSPGSSQGGSPALVYHSASVSQRPIVQVTLPSVNNASLPSTITAQLTFDGVTTASPVTFDTTGFAPGDVLTFALQADQTITATGRYGYSVLVQVPGQADQTVTGSTFVVAQDASPFGAGWGFAGVDQLVPIAADANGPAGMLRVYGTGGYRFYQGTSTFSSPPGDNGTLTLSGGTYTYATPDGQAWTFDSNGYMTGWTSADGKETLAYGYDMSGRLDGITAIDGGLTTFTYSSGDVAIETVNGRTTTLTLDYSGNLASVTNPDEGVRTFTYDDSHRLTREQYGLLENNWAFADTGVVATYTQGALSVGGVSNPSQTTYNPAVTRGIDALVSGLVFASQTDPTGHTDAWELDATGKWLEHVAPDGALTQRTYSSGYLASETDPLGRTTTYSLDTQGFVTQTTYPDGSHVTYQYQTAFHALTTMVNELGNATTYSYDSGGHRVGSTDALGNHTTYSYNATTGLQVTTVDPRGGTTTNVYDSDRRLISTTDPLGNTTTYGYDTNGNQATTTDALGHVTTTAYDAMGRSTSVTDALDNTTTTTYDASGLELTSTDPTGTESATVYDPFKRGLVSNDQNGVGSGNEVGQLSSYDAAGRQTGNRNAAGWSSSTKYDPDGRTIETVDPLGNTTETRWDAAGEKIAERDQMGRWTYYTYDARGRQTQVKDNLGNVTTTTYDAAGNSTVKTDALGHTTTYAYDADNRKTTVTDPLGRQATATYDAAGNVSTVTDSLGHVTSYSYDALNRKTAETDAAGTAVARTRATSYDAVGNVHTTTDALGNVTTYSYDADNRKTVVLDPLGHAVTTTYDAAGDATTSTDSLGKVTTYSYDALHQQTAQTDPLNHTTTNVLDANGKPAAQIDAQGNLTAAAIDPLGRPQGTLDATGAFQFNIYDGAGGVRLVVDPLGNEWHYVLDGVGRPTVRFDPLGAATTTTYDADGRVTQQTDRDGRVIQYSYDAAGQVTSAVWKNAVGTTVNSLTYTYDADGNRLTASDAAGTVTYTYDALKRVQTYTNVFGQVLTYTYDAEDHPIQRADSLGGVQTSTYDAVGLLTSREFGGSGQTPVRVDLGYTNRYELSSITDYADLAGTSLVATSTYSYDDAGHLTSIVNKDHTSATLSSYSYTYDSANQVLSQTWSSQVGTITYAGTDTYTYDSTGQLANDGTTGYSYDKAGNRTMTGYDTGAANRLTSDGVYTYTYDNEGNLIEKSKGAGQETWYFGYDNLNHLTSVRETSDGTTNVMLLTYTYDVEGKRVKEQSWGGSDPTETRFAYDGQNIWADLNASNAVQVRRMFGDRPDQLLTRIVVSGTNAGLWIYLKDAQGSVRDLVNASGQVKAHLDYDGYGVRTDPQSSVSDRYGYTGREWQADSGIQHNGQRDYLPGVGKWMQEDPISFAAGDFDVTRYVHNDPTNRTDPSGLDDLTTWITIGGLTFAGTAAAGYYVGVAGTGAVGELSSVGQTFLQALLGSEAAINTVLFVSGVLGLGVTLGASVYLDAYPNPAALGWDSCAGRKLDDGRVCFAAGTPLLTPEGSKPIEQFREGDLVLSRDETHPSGPVQAKAVMEVFTHDEHEVVELWVAGRVIGTTAEHPFWVVGKSWLPAKELMEGDRLLTVAGATVVVQQVTFTGRRERVYNLRIADFHTYFVGCQEWGFSVWAHNVCWYHGTDADSARDIVANGLDFDKWQKFIKAGGDGSGFSLTSKLGTAAQWAATSAALRGTPTGAVIVANENDLPRLASGTGVTGFDPGEKKILPKNFSKVGPGVFSIVVDNIPPLGGP